MGRVLMFSNPLMYCSAYSVQAYHLCKALQLCGHDIWFIDCGLPCQNQQEIFNVHEIREMYRTQHPEFLANIEERMDVLKDVKFVRYMYDTFPRELYVKDFNSLIKRYAIDFFIAFIDIWIIDTTDGVRFECPSLVNLPLHFQPIEELTVKAAGLFDTIVCLSHDGVKQMKKLFPEKRVLRIPHIIDVDLYSTLENVDRKEIRRELNIPEDCYLVSIVQNLSEATNRKSVETTMQAFKLFHERHPYARLYMHVKLDNAIDCHEIIDHLEVPREALLFSDQKKMTKGGYTFDWVVKLYRASDVLLNATVSEGFSVVLAEAVSVGTPVVATNTTAMPDNMFNGELASIYQQKFCIQNTSYWELPRVSSIVECLEKVYNRTPEETKRKARYGIRRIREECNFLTLFNGWRALLEPETSLDALD